MAVDPDSSGSMAGAKRPGGGYRLWRLAGLVAGGGLLLLLTAWSIAALYIDVRVSWLQLPLATAYGLAMLGACIRLRRHWLAPVLVVAGFGAVLLWWLTLAPTNDAHWQDTCAKLAHADIVGNRVTVHGVRNFDYRSETDYDIRYDDRTYDLADLRTADLYMNYWGMPFMAHTMMSFGFADGRYLCFSIETRKKVGQSYSALRGLFRQFELVYVVGDERDLVRFRTTYEKGDEIYVYRLRWTPEQARAHFIAYLDSLDALYEKPAWYNAVSHNCTTSIRVQTAASDRAPWDWRMLANGYGDQMLYERGLIDTSLPFAELKERSHINARGQAADKDPDFSRRIRDGLPGMESSVTQSGPRSP